MNTAIYPYTLILYKTIVSLLLLLYYQLHQILSAIIETIKIFSYQYITIIAKRHIKALLKYKREEKIVEAVDTGNIRWLKADVKIAFDYYPFGSIMPGRSFNANSYSYGFNGQEKDDEITGVTGGHLNYKFREYDTRLARFFAIDPIAADYPMLTPYQHSSLNPIMNIELEGLEGVPANEKTNDKGLPTGHTTAQSSSYVPPATADINKNDNPSANTPAPIKPNSVGQYNPNGLNKNQLNKQQQVRGVEFKATEFNKVASEVHPTSYGSSTTGLGLAPCLIEGIKQAPLTIIAPELLAYKLTKLAKPVLGYKLFSKSTKGMFTGANHSKLRGAAYQLHKKSMNSPLLQSKIGGVIEKISYGSDAYSIGSGINNSTSEQQQQQ